MKKYNDGLSRQRRYQLRKKAAGLCAICGKLPIAKHGRCGGCAVKDGVISRERMRKLKGCVRRNLKSKSYQVGAESEAS